MNSSKESIYSVDDRKYTGLWIRSYQSTLREGITKDPTCRHLFQDLLLKASFGKSNACFNGQHFKLLPGQLVTSIAELEGITAITPNKIRRAIKQLVESGLITMKTTNKGTIITVCDWGNYQGLDNSNHKQIHNTETVNHKTDTITDVSNNLQYNLIEHSQKKIEDLDKRAGVRITPDEANAKQISATASTGHLEQILTEVMNELVEIGSKYREPTKTEKWKKDWEGALSEVIPEVSKQVEENSEDVILVTVNLIKQFFQDLDRRKRSATFAKYFTEDWMKYWPKAEAYIERIKKSEKEKRIEEMMLELQKEFPNKTPDERRRIAQEQLRKTSGYPNIRTKGIRHA